MKKRSIHVSLCSLCLGVKGLMDISTMIPHYKLATSSISTVSLHQPPPPPHTHTHTPSNGVKQTHAVFCSQGSKSYNFWRKKQRGEGGFARFGPYFCCHLEKRNGHFLTQKESACQISVESKQLEKSLRNRYIALRRIHLVEGW